MFQKIQIDKEVKFLEIFLLILENLKRVENNNDLKIQRRIQENDSEEFISTKQLLVNTKKELEDCIFKFNKTHDIYTEYFLSLTQEKNKLEGVNLQNDK